MFKINNKIYKEDFNYEIGTVFYKKQIYNVIDLIIKYEEKGILKTHYFEGVENLDYLKKLKVGKEIHKSGISGYLCFENNDLNEKGMDIDYIVDINLENVKVKCKRIDEDNIDIIIEIKELNILFKNFIKIAQM